MLLIRTANQQIRQQKLLRIREILLSLTRVRKLQTSANLQRLHQMRSLLESPSGVKMAATEYIIVEKGDTLAIISRKMYGDISHVDAICRMNGIEDGDLIYVGRNCYYHKIML